MHTDLVRLSNYSLINMLGNKTTSKWDHTKTLIHPKVDLAGKSKEFKKLRKQYSDWNKVYTSTYIEDKLDKIATPNIPGWRTRTPSHYQTLMLITSRIIPDGKVLGVNKRATQPSQNSVSTVCRLIRLVTRVELRLCIKKYSCTVPLFVFLPEIYIFYLDQSTIACLSNAAITG